jgi:hypothetical protein
MAGVSLVFWKQMASRVELLGGWDGCRVQRCTWRWGDEFLLWRMGLVSQAEWWHLEHTMEHQLSESGLSIESVPEFQYMKWRLHPIVGCHRSRIGHLKLVHSGCGSQRVLKNEMSAGTETVPAQELPNPYSSNQLSSVTILQTLWTLILRVAIGNCPSWPKQYACAAYFPTHCPARWLSPVSIILSTTSFRTNRACKLFFCGQLTRLIA